MITPLSAPKIKQLFKIEFSNASNLSQVGGLAVFLEFLRKAEIQKRLDQVVGPIKAKALMEVMLGVLAGADSMEGVAGICKDPQIKGFMAKPLSATQITRTLREIRPSEIQALHDFSLSLGLLDAANSLPHGRKMTVDVDATSLEKHGGQEGVEVGYVDRDAVAPCYQYLFFRNDQLNSLLYGTLRGGSAHSQNNFCGYLRRILPLFAGDWTLNLRADSGFFGEDAFDYCSEHRTHFFIKAPMTAARVAQANSQNLKWEKDFFDEDVEYSSYETRSAKGYVWREIFKRVRSRKKSGELLGDQMTFCLATNDLKRSNSSCYTFYNGRARIENTILEMKEDFALGGIVTQWFSVNDAITQMTIILYQLFSHFKRHCLDKAFQPKRLSTLRSQVFNVPARILTSGRRTWARVYNRFHGTLFYGRIFARIMSLRTVLVVAHRLSTA